MLKPKALLLVVVCLFLLTFQPVLAAPSPAPSAYDLIAAVNAYRAENNMPPYYIDPLLMIAAQGQADYLASQHPNVGDGHVGPGGTDADARAAAVGYPYVPGLDINENWGMLHEGMTLDTLIHQAWGDEAHTHTMLHWRGQHVGAGAATVDGVTYYILDVAAFWGDGGLTQQPTSSGYTEYVDGTPFALSQYIAPVQLATPQPDGKLIHQVMSGQSLWAIAIAYGVKIADIRSLNGLPEDASIYIGQKLLIKVVDTPLPTIEHASSAPAQTPKTTPRTTANATPVKSEHRADPEGNRVSDEPLFIPILIFSVVAVGILLILFGWRNE